MVRAIKDQVDVFIAAPDEAPYGPKFRELSKDFFALPHRSFRVDVLIRLLIWARRHQIKIIHSHGRGAGYYSRLLYFLGFKILHTPHGVHREESFWGELKFLSDRLLSYFTDQFIFVSEGEKHIAEQLKFKNAHKGQILFPILNGSDRPLPKQGSTPLKDPPFFTFGSLGRIDPIKGIEGLLDMLQEFKKAHPEIQWKWIHAGPGVPPMVPEAIRDQVTFMGPVDDPQMLFDRIDGFIAPSISESFNLSVAEALMAGIPCLISNIPGHEHYLKAGVALRYSIENCADFFFKAPAS
ncbi:MAG: glycosyltransferase family 4 protein [Bdellovibrionales bacterium]|nr:glycosyltransferase family 4 protein [Bdellovibrionales bacterium]